jgi:hypothetical protein
MSRYRITTLTLQGISLTFHVSNYNIGPGDYVEFIDEKTKEPKKFHASRTEIVEEKQ